MQCVNIDHVLNTYSKEVIAFKFAIDRNLLYKPTLDLGDAKHIDSSLQYDINTTFCIITKLYTRWHHHIIGPMLYQMNRNFHVNKTQ